MKNKMLYIFFAIGAILALTPLGIVSYFILVLSSAAVIPLFKNAGILVRAVFSFLLITCAHQLMGLLFWRLDVPFSLYFALIPLYIIIITFALIQGRRGHEPSLTTTKDDFIAGIFTLASIGMLAGATFFGAPAAQQSLRYVARGFDNSTHMSIILANYNNENLVYGDASSTQDDILWGFSGYPQGWHLSNSLLWKGLPVEITNEKPAQLLFTYTLTTFLWFSCLLFLAFTLIITIGKKLVKTKFTVVEYFSVFIAGLLLQIIVLVGLLSSGFSNYISVLSYLLAILLLLFKLLDSKITSSQYVITTSFLAAGMSLTWLLTAPFGYIFVFAPFLLSEHPVRLLVSFVKQNTYIALLAALILGIGTMQVAIQLGFGTGASHINAAGVSWPLNHVLLASLLFVGIYMILSKSISASLQKFAKISICVVALVVGLVYVYQYHAIAMTAYYTEKLILSLEIVLLLFAGALFTYCAYQVGKRVNKLVACVAIIGLALMTLVLLGIDTSSTRYMLGHRELSHTTAAQITELLAQDKGSHNNILVIKDLNQFEDVSTTHTIDTMASDIRPDKCMRELNNALFIGQIDLRIEAAKTCAHEHKDRTYYIISSGSSESKILEETRNIPNIQVILSN